MCKIRSINLQEAVTDILSHGGTVCPPYISDFLSYVPESVHSGCINRAAEHSGHDSVLVSKHPLNFLIFKFFLM